MPLSRQDGVIADFKVTEKMLTVYSEGRATAAPGIRTSSGASDYAASGAGLAPYELKFIW
jgi:hypothetical protein